MRRSTAPRRSGSPLPLVRLNGDVDPEHLKSLDRELAIAVTAEGTRLPNTPQMRTVGRLVLSALDKAVAEHPDDLVALRMKAQALAFTGRYAEALRIADSLLKSTPSYELLLDDYTSYAIDLRNFQAALEPVPACRRAESLVRGLPRAARLRLHAMSGLERRACTKRASASPQSVPQVRACFWCNASCTTRT